MVPGLSARAEPQLADITANSSTLLTAEPTFEQALAALEQIVHDLEEGRVGLADALAKYEDGVKLLKQCYSQLEQAERRIELLTGTDAAGNPVTRPFDDEATITIEEEGKRRGRRGNKTAKQAVDEPSIAAPPPSSEIDEPGSLF
jgi:exodeoxyribonuclease VII small subunit